MESFSYLKSYVSGQFRENQQRKKQELVTKILSLFGSLKWHHEQMNDAFVNNAWDYACAYADWISYKVANFPILFGELGYQMSNNKEYVSMLQKIINFRTDYAASALSVKQQIDQRIRAAIVLPEYVRFTFSIEQPEILEPECDEDTWVALGMFAAYENLVSMSSENHIAREYLARMESIIKSKLHGFVSPSSLHGVVHFKEEFVGDGQLAFDQQPPHVVIDLALEAVCLEEEPSFLHCRFYIQERMDRARLVADGLPHTVSVVQFFDLNSGFAQATL